MLLWYKKKYLKNHPKHWVMNATNSQFLKYINVLRLDKVTYAGILCFGKPAALEKAILGYEFQYLEIDGTSWYDSKEKFTYQDPPPFEKNLFYLFRYIYPRLKRSLNNKYQEEEGRQISYNHSYNSIKEAVVNMLVHADYFGPSYSRIRVFNDRIELKNPGGMISSPSYFLRSEESRVRNGRIMRLFRNIGLSQRFGSGLHNIISGWSKDHSIKPVFHNSPERLIVILYKYK